MKILVTGATGFIGRYLVRELLSANHEVTVMVRNAGKAEALGFWNNVRHVEHNLEVPCPSDFWKRCGEPEIVYHLAWERLHEYGSLHHIEENLPRHYRFLKSLAVGGCPRVVVTGTCFEYGRQSGALREDCPADPAIPYAVAKHCLHLMAEQLCRRTGMQMIWGRLFYLFGEGQPTGTLLSQLNRALAEGKPFFELSGGEQLRDYLPVEEAAVLLRKIGEGVRHTTTLNVGIGRPVSIRTLVERLVAKSGKTIQLRWGAIPYKPYEAMAFWADTRKLCDALGDPCV